MADRDLPAHPEAEQSVLGAMMLSASSRQIAAEQLIPEDFHGPTNGRLFAVLAEMHEDGLPVDPVTVWGEVARVGGQLAETWTQKALLQLQGYTPASTNVVRYVDVVAEAATRRRLMALGLDLADQAADEAIPLADVIEAAAEQTDLARDTLTTHVTARTLDVFLDGPTELDWLTPGLIARQDRILLVAKEGHGKSTLLRQVAVCVAAGIDLFGRSEIVAPAQRVLLIDCENSERKMRADLHPLVGPARHVARDQWDPTNMVVVSRPQGMDLGRRADAAWLHGLCSSHRPDLLVIGPVYKLSDGDDNDAQHVRRVQAVLDRVRVRFGCAVLMETHAPHDVADSARLRPSGSRLWIRWPETLLGLKAVDDDSYGVPLYDLQRVRPFRNGPMDFPKRVQWGARGFPWVRADD